MNQHIKNSIYLGIGLTVFTYAVGLALGWITEVNFLEVFAVATSYSCTWLCTVQSRVNYLIGVITTAAYSWLFYTTGAVALAVFNLYLVFSLAYGWFRWGSDTNTRPVTFSSDADYLVNALIALVVTGLFYSVMWLLNVDLASISAIDVSLAVASGVAQFMLDNKKLENWIVWAAINIVSIPYFYSLGLYLVAFQYVFFLINTYIGYKAWKKTM